MTVKEHYNNHLANFYSWMSGDFSIKSSEFKNILTKHSIVPFSNKIAIDLGSGHGIQSIAMAETGFEVIAVDFNQHLLDELKVNAQNHKIKTINDDIKNVNAFANKPELIVCCGDTLTHLNNIVEIKSFLLNIANTLCENGKMILSFRDYSKELKDTQRFIPVKSDDNKILTCILEYENEFVNVTDLLYQKTNNVWVQKVSFYKKVRVTSNEIIEQLEKIGLKIKLNEISNGLTTIIAIK